jgi:hypothetical protein
MANRRLFFVFLALLIVVAPTLALAQGASADERARQIEAKFCQECSAPLARVCSNHSGRCTYPVE